MTATKTQLFEIRPYFSKDVIATFVTLQQAEDYLLARACYLTGYYTHCNYYKSGEDGVAASYGDMNSNGYNIVRVTK